MKKKSTPWFSTIQSDWTYLVDFDSNRSGCICRDNYDYCRCTTVSPTVNYVHYDYAISNILPSNISFIKKYAADRIIRRIVTSDSFNCYGAKGYYGEEPEVKICDNVKNELQKKFSLLDRYMDSEAIALSLELEYGNVLPQFTECKWIKKSVSMKLIRDSISKVDSNVVAKYTGYETILTESIDDGTYRIIDGNHRFAAAKIFKKKKMKIITTDLDYELKKKMLIDYGFSCFRQYFSKKTKRGYLSLYINDEIKYSWVDRNGSAEGYSSGKFDSEDFGQWVQKLLERF